MLLYYFTMIYVSVYRCVYRNIIYAQHVCVHTYYMYIYIHIDTRCNTHLDIQI